ncbi:hypothetical protein BY996DRAFT_6581933 [Phakopsora pachyrhizi]|nr:hypothetical protein BY996DRAFT_6581933 [Phakopsora pachyrhizi]
MQTGAGGQTDLAIAKVYPNIDEKVSTSPEIHSYFDPIRPEQSLLSNRCLVGVRCSHCLRWVNVEVSDQENQERQEREKVLERIRGLITVLRTKRKSDKHHSHLISVQINGHETIYQVLGVKDQDTEEGFTDLQPHSSRISSSKHKEEEQQKRQSIDKSQKGISDSLSSSNSWPTVQLFEKLREISENYEDYNVDQEGFDDKTQIQTQPGTSPLFSSPLRFIKSKYHSHEDPKGINKEYYFEEERAKDEKSRNKSESEVEGMDMANNQCVVRSVWKNKALDEFNKPLRLEGWGKTTHWPRYLLVDGVCRYSELLKVINRAGEDLGLPMRVMGMTKGVWRMKAGTVRGLDKRTEEQRIQDKEDRGLQEEEKETGQRSKTEKQRIEDIGVKKSPIKARSFISLNNKSIIKE